MELTIDLFLFLSPFAQLFTAAQTTLTEYCTDGMADADFYQCNYSNTATCTDCEDEDIYINNINFTTRADLTDHVCPFFLCWFACETKTGKFFECSIYPDYTNSITTLQSCDIDCSAFPYGNNQNGAAEPCEVEWESWVVCTSNDYKSSLDCFVDDDHCMPNDSDKCADEQQSFCFYFDCCPSCQFEWTAAYHCDIDLESTSSTINSTCPLNCNGDNIITASGGISNGNGTSGGITNGGTSSGNTTSGNGTNSGSQIKNGATKYVTFYLFLLSILSLKVYWHLFTLCKESGAANRTHLV